jgi:hypothetical protein
MWAMLQTFRRYMLLPSSGSKWVNLWTVKEGDVVLCEQFEGWPDVSAVDEIFVMQTSALNLSVYTIFSVHCPYWPKLGTNILFILPSSILAFRNKMSYIQRNFPTYTLGSEDSESALLRSSRQHRPYPHGIEIIQKYCFLICPVQNSVPQNWHHIWRNKPCTDTHGILQRHRVTLTETNPILLTAFYFQRRNTYQVHFSVSAFPQEDVM